MKSIKITTIKQFMIVVITLFIISIPFDYYYIQQLNLFEYIIQNTFELSLVLLGFLFGLRTNKDRVLLKNTNQ